METHQMETIPYMETFLACQTAYYIKQGGFGNFFYSKIPEMETISYENYIIFFIFIIFKYIFLKSYIFQGQFIDFPMPILLFLKIQLGRSQNAIN